MPQPEQNGCSPENAVRTLCRKVRTAWSRPQLLAIKPRAWLVGRVLRRTSGVAAVRQWRDDLLRTWAQPAARSWLGNALFDDMFAQWMSDVYLAEPDPDRREALKAICMGGASGTAWADHYEATPIDRNCHIGELSFDDAVPLYPALDRLLSDAAPDTLVVQIGTSSGRDIAYFARRYPQMQFLGTDIDTAIAERATRIHPLPNLRFSLARAHTLLNDTEIPNRPRLVVMSNGSLQYVQPEHIPVFFKRLHARGNVAVILVEPAARQTGREPDQIGGSTWRGQFSYSHDYRAYAQRAGFATLAWDVIRPTKDPQSPHRDTRHYFYYGQA